MQVPIKFTIRNLLTLQSKAGKMKQKSIIANYINILMLIFVNWSPVHLCSTAQGPFVYQSNLQILI